MQVDLLRTYSADELPTASADAHQCIIDAVADPEALLLDHLLVLLPIEALKGTEVHEVETLVDMSLRSLLVVVVAHG